MSRTVKVGIDVGGTFTHAVAVEEATGALVGKAVVPTTHRHEDGVASGVVASMRKLLADAAIEPDDVSLIAHSTTQATNALLEGDVAKVGVIALGTGAQGLRAKREANVGTVDLGPGAELETTFRYVDTATTAAAFDASIEAALDGLLAEGALAIVAAEPFSVDDPAREAHVCALAAARGVPATATSTLTQLYGLRIRTLTAVINASMLPIMIETADRTARAVRESGMTAPIMVMRSDGGIMDLEAMRTRPILTMLSGPAAGVAAALMAERITDGIFVEVGGTSSDICLIRNGRPEIKAAEIGGNRLFIRTLDVRTVGVAGGSMPRVRRGKLHRVGPRSAHIAGLAYEAFEQELTAPEAALLRPRERDPEDYVGLRTAKGVTHAVTPTGAATLLGLAHGYGQGSVQSAQSAFDALAALVGGTAKDAAKRVLELASSGVAPTIRRLLKEHRIDAADSVLIGGGGGAEAIVPFTAKSMGMPHRIAEHAEVISAIGAALGILQDSVERTLLSPTEAELLALRREAFDRVVAMGAAPESVTVHVEVDRRERRVRATASGAPEMRERDIASARLSDAALVSRAQECLAIETLNTIGDETASLRTFGGERREPILFGLWKVWRMPAVVLDRDGGVRYRCKDAWLEGAAARGAEGRVRELVERYSTWGDGGVVAPEVRIVKPHAIADLSGLGDAEQIVAMAGAELSDTAPEDRVALLVTARK